MKFILAFIVSFMFAPAFAITPDLQVGYIAISGAIKAASVPAQLKYGVTLVATVPTSDTFGCVSGTDVCTSSGQIWATGLQGTMGTTGTLPGNLTTGVNYWAVQQSTSAGVDFKVASSLGNAVAGTTIDVTSVGTGIHTFFPVAFVSAAVKLQGSVDGTNYADLPIKATGDATKSLTILAAGNYYLSEDNAAVNYIRPYISISGGQVNIIQRSKVK